MSITLWIVAIVTALAFVVAGSLKLTQPKDKLKQQMGWVEDYSPNAIRLIGATEVLGALGLILSAVTGIATVLVPLAAAGLAVVMVLASIVHLRRGEPKVVPVNIVLFLLAAFVAVGRFAFPYDLEDRDSNSQPRQHSQNEVAAARDVTTLQVALAWLLKRDDQVIATPGHQADHVRQNSGALTLGPSDEELGAIDRASTPTPAE